MSSLSALSAFLACESKSNLKIFSTSLINKRLFCDISCNFLITVLISCLSIFKFKQISQYAPPPSIPHFMLGVEHPTKFSKMGGLGRISVFRAGLPGKRGWLISGRGEGYSFYIKNKLKPEIFNDKKSL